MSYLSASEVFYHKALYKSTYTVVVICHFGTYLSHFSNNVNETTTLETEIGTRSFETEIETINIGLGTSGTVVLSSFHWLLLGCLHTIQFAFWKDSLASKVK